MIAVTGASGQLGRLVMAELLNTVAATELVALVRSPDSVTDLSERGITVRQADYNDSDGLAEALSGVDRLLLISSSEVGQREVQHGNVIAAAKKAGVRLVGYTSILHCDSSPLPLAQEHKATEDLLADSGLPYVLLRNGWYSENYAAGLPAAVERGAMVGCAGDGKIASAPRVDYAHAAARIMTSENPAGQIYELAGDEAYTLTELAALVSEISGKTVSYQNLDREAYAGLLRDAGLPEAIAAMLSESEAGAAQGGLYDNSLTLSQVLHRPTEPMRTTVARFIK